MRLPFLLLIAVSVTACSTNQPIQNTPIDILDPTYGSRFIVPVEKETELTKEERLANRLRLELISSFSGLKADIKNLVTEQVMLAFNEMSAGGSMHASNSSTCTPGDLGKMHNAGIVYQEKSRKQLRDDQHEKRSFTHKKNINVDVLMRLNSRLAQRYWWDLLSEKGVKDKFMSQNMGEYLIYLGHFTNYDQANKRMDQITSKIGEDLVEIVVSKQTNI